MMSRKPKERVITSDLLIWIVAPLLPVVDRAVSGVLGSRLNAAALMFLLSLTANYLLCHYPTLSQSRAGAGRLPVVGIQTATTYVAARCRYLRLSARSGYPIGQSNGHLLRIFLCRVTFLAGQIPRSAARSGSSKADWRS